MNKDEMVHFYDFSIAVATEIAKRDEAIKQLQAKVAELEKKEVK